MNAGVAFALAFAVATTTVPPAELAGMRALQAQDARVASVAFKLATANARRCPNRQLWSGFVLHSLGQYAPRSRPAARALFGLDRYPTVLAIVPGSEAQRAGISVGDEIRSVDGRSVAEPGGKSASMVGVDGANAALSVAMAKGVARILIAHSGEEREISLAGTPGCASRVELVPGNSLNAKADGETVQLTSAVVGEARDDDELAFVISHEMSHNILRHAALLRVRGRTARNIRETEIEADTLALTLMRGAGFDSCAASRFWARFGKRTGGGLFSDGTHLGTKSRVAMLRMLGCGHT